ncbi:hypothetical protein FJT64_017335 [Amphibalanus amphitrite]|uniref:Uncharacterized protein n=1 Tax=Amphibalanus amphitrite TaxID=1232801 RepID=A0A6A4WXQ3_AMPAM|nr:hypothetical protein FJT64_017335 [Amphibalanus amphitrite]
MAAMVLAALALLGGASAQYDVDDAGDYEDDFLNQLQQDYALRAAHLRDGSRDVDYERSPPFGRGDYIDEVYDDESDDD